VVRGVLVRIRTGIYGVRVRRLEPLVDEDVEPDAGIAPACKRYEGLLVLDTVGRELRGRESNPQYLSVTG
jgi:hypothetical protein